MLQGIDINSFAAAIKQSYKMMTDTSSINLAAQLVQVLDEDLKEAVEAWIAGKEIPDVSIGKYSINKILTIRNNSDYLQAFKLLSEY